MRIPGVGINSARKIVQGRTFGKLGWEHLRKLGIAVNRAKYFIVCRDKADAQTLELPDTTIRKRILAGAHSKFVNHYTSQLALF
jgi:predicted DNA-binding helix-hairpin-helix protein